MPVLSPPGLRKKMFPFPSNLLQAHLHPIHSPKAKAGFLEFGLLPFALPCFVCIDPLTMLLVLQALNPSVNTGDTLPRASCVPAHDLGGFVHIDEGGQTASRSVPSLNARTCSPADGPLGCFEFGVLLRFVLVLLFCPCPVALVAQGSRVHI